MNPPSPRLRRDSLPYAARRRARTAGPAVPTNDCLWRDKGAHIVSNGFVWLRPGPELGCAGGTSSARLTPLVLRSAFGRRHNATPSWCYPRTAIRRNEPISFSINYRWIGRVYRTLCRLQRRLQMGSFGKNEAISRWFWRGENGRDARSTPEAPNKDHGRESTSRGRYQGQVS